MSTAAPFWAAERLATLPKRWAERMEHEWRQFAGVNAGKHWANGVQFQHAGADAWLERRLQEIEAGKRAGITPAMDDDALCKLAKAEARDHRDRQASLAGEWRAAHARSVPSDDLGAALLQHLTADAMHVMQGRGLDDLWPDGAGMTPAGRLARLQCEAFWRRVYRKAHARTVESCAIALGLVHGGADAYVSRESLRIQAQRQAANAAMMANTVCVGEYGQELTLASIAEKSVSNPTIRRGELMTRVAGFELCADGLGHAKRWAVLTCPSKMHKWTHVGDKAFPNKRYDGTKPREAQAWLSGQWRKVCAWWERQGLRVYGFRTTEPHRDGTPHWNVLCFFAPMTERVELKKVCKLARPAVAVFDEGLRRYFLDAAPEDTPQMQRAAEKHRVKVQAIDDSKGSAAAYIAKYISKGIDGQGVDLDLWGNPIERTSRAVVAWSRVWGIRQFQQIGGPPVTVWRELRKLNPENLGTEQATAHTMREAMAAVNIRLDDPEARQALAWQRYTNTQGGPTCKRKGWTVRMLMQQRETVNRYGEAAMARVVGVWAVGRVSVPTPAHLVAMGSTLNCFTRPAATAIESERCAWVVVPKSGVDDALIEHCNRLEKQLVPMRKRDEELREALRTVEGELTGEELRKREALAPWTRVNNCTATPTLDRIDRRHMDTAPTTFGLLKVRRKKLGRHYNWNKEGAGGPLQHESNKT